MAATLGGLGSGTYRVTFMFNYMNIGWSETWWHDGTTIGDVVPQIINYVAKRLAMQPTTVVLGGVRVSQEGQSRKNRLFEGGFNDGATGYAGFTLQARGNFPGGDTLAWDIGQQAVQAEVLVEGVRVGFRYIAILPDLVSTTNPATIDFNAVPTWRNAYIAWTDQIRADGWQIRVSQATSLRPETRISSWIRSTDPGADWSFVLRPQTAGSGIGLDKYVIVRAARMKYSGVQSPNGRWRVSKIVTDTTAGTVTMTLAGTASLSLQYLASQGAVYPLGADYLVPNGLSPYAVTRHKRGGPFPRERGRVRKQRFPPS